MFNKMNWLLLKFNFGPHWISSLNLQYLLQNSRCSLVVLIKIVINKKKLYRAKKNNWKIFYKLTWDKNSNNNYLLCQKLAYNGKVVTKRSWLFTPVAKSQTHLHNLFTFGGWWVVEFSQLTIPKNWRGQRTSKGHFGNRTLIVTWMST